MRRLGASRVMVLTDAGLADGEAVRTALDSLADEGIDAVLFDQVRVEPTDVSFREASAFAAGGGFDGYVAVGGGSAIDTAKAANLYATYPADLRAYVNAPIGRGELVPGPLEPLIAVPTTTGTGSETTGVAIFDLLEMKAKTGISHRALRPAVGIVDPDNTRTLPPMVTACSGLDVLCHGLESYTAMPFGQREAPANPGLRPGYQGANPISDVWSTRWCRPRSSAPSTTRTTTTPAARCCSPRRWPASASGTRAATCRTACRTRRPGWCATTCRTATLRASRLSPTACPSP